MDEAASLVSVATSSSRAIRPEGISGLWRKLRGWASLPTFVPLDRTFAGQRLYKIAPMESLPGPAGSARMKSLLFIAVMLAAAPAAGAQPAPSPRTPAVPAPALRDGSRDFDFEFGNWRAHIARRLKPLTGSTDWV